MNTQTKEALKMAIYALEKAQREIDESQGKRATMQDWGFYQDRIKACKEALEQPAQEPLTRAQQVIRANNTAQPTQEPVAWTKESELTRVTTLRFPMAMWKNKYASIENNIPLYTHPHQWQGLTDDEIQELTHYDIKFARAIEQSLREKNT